MSNNDEPVMPFPSNKNTLNNLFTDTRFIFNDPKPIKEETLLNQANVLMKLNTNDWNKHEQENLKVCLHELEKLHEELKDKVYRSKCEREQEIEKLHKEQETLKDCLKEVQKLRDLFKTKSSRRKNINA